MAAITFDTLKFARRLESAGVPIEQAEARAEILAEAFLHNLDQLVTRDDLDARIAELEGRLEVRFAEVDGKFRQMFWMQAVIVAAVVIPQLATLVR